MKLQNLIDEMEVISLQYQIYQKLSKRKKVEVNNLPEPFYNNDIAFAGDYSDYCKLIEEKPLYDRISEDDLAELHEARSESESEAKNYIDYLYIKYDLDKKEYRISIRDGSINKLIK